MLFRPAETVQSTVLFKKKTVTGFLCRIFEFKTLPLGDVVPKLGIKEDRRLIVDDAFKRNKCVATSRCGK